MKIEYKINSAKLSDIHSHLVLCNQEFVPPLEQRIDISIYSNKIFEKATLVEAWDNDLLIGLVAIYINQESKSFITNVSVNSSHQGKGIAKELVKNTIEFAVSKKSLIIELEVNHLNNSAILLYKKFDFIPIGNNDNNLIMQKNI